MAVELAEGDIVLHQKGVGIGMYGEVGEAGEDGAGEVGKVSAGAV
jgi:hypothetical protein